MKHLRMLLCTIFILTLFIQSTTGQLEQANPAHEECVIVSEYPTDLTGVKVAIYEGYSSDLCLSSKIALFNMFNWMSASVDYLNSSQIYMGEAIWEYDILVIPDGHATRFESNLGFLGLEIIRNWVEKGGSYFGVRAGATMACKYSFFYETNEEYHLPLFNGTGYGPIETLDEMCITTININRTAIPTLTGMPSQLEVLYRVTRYFVPNEGQEMIPIGNYDANGKTGMLACHYGTGCVFISGLNPEFEENSARDGTDYMDEYDDPDSEWPLMFEISKWLVDESEWNIPETPTEPTTTSSTPSSTTNNTTTESSSQRAIPTDFLLIGSGVSAVAIVMIALLVRKRR